MAKQRLIEGTVVGRLTFLEYLGTDHAQKQLVRCACSCGKELVMRYNNLGRHTHSCGCLRSDLMRETRGKPLADLAARHVYNGCKRHTKDTNVTFEQVRNLIFSNCYYCEGTPEEVGTLWKRPIPDGRVVKRIGIDRIDSRLGYYVGNVIPCCKVCNYIKRDHDNDQLLTRLEKFVANMKKLQDKQL